MKYKYNKYSTEIDDEERDEGRREREREREGGGRGNLRGSLVLNINIIRPISSNYFIIIIFPFSFFCLFVLPTIKKKYCLLTSLSCTETSQANITFIEFL